MSEENISKSVFVTFEARFHQQHRQVFNFFNALGNIENYIMLEDDIYYENMTALITFATIKEAAKYKQNIREELKTKLLVFSIKSADDWLQDQKLILPYDYKEYDEHSPTPLLSLPIDCLLEISKYLDVFDLIELSETCKTMKSFVDEIVFLRFKTLHLDFKSTKLAIYLLRYFNMKWLAKRFRQLDDIHALHLIFIMASISKYFYNLQELHLVNARPINCKYLKLYKKEFEYFPKLNQLKVLTLVNCENVCDTIISATSILIELHLVNSYAFYYTAIIKKLRHLRKLSINDSNVHWENGLNILKQNSKLTHLTLKNLHKCDKELYSTISNINSLQYLALDYDVEWPLENLNCLKSLNIGYSLLPDLIPTIKALADKDQLEELRFITYWDFTDGRSIFEQNLLRFTKIQTLNVCDSYLISEPFLLQLATKWNLISLSCSGIRLSDKAILKIVEMNKNMKYLHRIELSSSLVRCIIEMIKNDSERPKLVLIAKTDEKLLNSLCERVEIKGPELIN